MGVSKARSEFLVSIVGVANTIGRIVLGYLSDKTWINRLFVYNASLTTCGIGKYRHVTNQPHFSSGTSIQPTLISLGNSQCLSCK